MKFITNIKNKIMGAFIDRILADFIVKFRAQNPHTWAIVLGLIWGVYFGLEAYLGNTNNENTAIFVEAYKYIGIVYSFLSSPRVHTIIEKNEKSN